MPRGPNEIQQFVEAYKKHLRLDSLTHLVRVVHGDGTVLFFDHALLTSTPDGEWYAVFTEHNGNHLYHYEDVKRIDQYTRALTSCVLGVIV